MNTKTNIKAAREAGQMNPGQVIKSEVFIEYIQDERGWQRIEFDYEIPAAAIAARRRMTADHSTGMTAQNTRIIRVAAFVVEDAK
jgi:hypothetical protein